LTRPGIRIDFLRGGSGDVANDRLAGASPAFAESSHRRSCRNRAAAANLYVRDDLAFARLHSGIGRFLVELPEGPPLLAKVDVASSNAVARSGPAVARIPRPPGI